jgi:hypothetical protein
VAPALGADTLTLRAAASFLASDGLLGRGTGTRAGEVAAACPASECRRLVFQALTAEGYAEKLPPTQATIMPGGRSHRDTTFLAPPRSWRIAGPEGSALVELVRGEAVREGWAATLARPSPGWDYYPFVRHGVPAVFFVPGDGPYEGLGVTTSDSYGSSSVTSRTGPGGRR